jgi:hypothetical protein
MNKPTQVRKIKPTRLSVSGLHSFRGEIAVPYESTLERDFVKRCEFQLSVVEVISQPIEIPFIGQNGRKYKYTPDYLVYYKLGSRSYENYPKPLLVEVKPREKWKKHFRDWCPKWKAANKYSKEQGWRFRIYDEFRIRDSVLKNIKFLERYTRMRFDIEDMNQILETVSEMGTCSVDYLIARFYCGHSKAQGIALIWHLLGTRKLECDIIPQLNHLTELWLPENE